MEGNVVALKRLTGLHVTAMQCKAIVEHHYLVAQAVPLLEARGYKALQQNLRSGGGLEAVGALPLQQPPVGQAPPPGALLPAGVINAGAAVVHQVVPVAAEEEEEEEAFGDVDAADGALEEEAGAELEVRETALERKKRRDKERLRTKRNALTHCQEQKDATKKKDREDKQTKRDNEGPPEGDARKQKRRSADARRGAVRVGAAPRAPSDIIN